MNCKKCGNELKEIWEFCPNCFKMVENNIKVINSENIQQTETVKTVENQELLKSDGKDKIYLNMLKKSFWLNTCGLIVFFIYTMCKVGGVFGGLFSGLNSSGADIEILYFLFNVSVLAPYSFILLIFLGIILCAITIPTIALDYATVTSKNRAAVISFYVLFAFCYMAYNYIYGIIYWLLLFRIYAHIYDNKYSINTKNIQQTETVKTVENQELPKSESKDEIYLIVFFVSVALCSIGQIRGIAFITALISIVIGFIKYPKNRAIKVLFWLFLAGIVLNNIM